MSNLQVHSPYYLPSVQCVSVCIEISNEFCLVDCLFCEFQNNHISTINNDIVVIFCALYIIYYL